MLNVKTAGQFKKDYRRCEKRGLDIEELKAIVAVLAIPDKLDEKNAITIWLGIMRALENAI